MSNFLPIVQTGALLIGTMGAAGVQVLSEAGILDIASKNTLSSFFNAFIAVGNDDDEMVYAEEAARTMTSLHGGIAFCESVGIILPISKDTDFTGMRREQVGNLIVAAKEALASGLSRVEKEYIRATTLYSMDSANTELATLNSKYGMAMAATGSARLVTSLQSSFERGYSPQRSNQGNHISRMLREVPLKIATAFAALKSVPSIIDCGGDFDFNADVRRWPVMSSTMTASLLTPSAVAGNVVFPSNLSTDYDAASAFVSNPSGLTFGGSASSSSGYLQVGLPTIGSVQSVNMSALSMMDYNVTRTASTGYRTSGELYIRLAGGSNAGPITSATMNAVTILGYISTKPGDAVQLLSSGWNWNRFVSKRIVQHTLKLDPSSVNRQDTLSATLSVGGNFTLHGYVKSGLRLKSNQTFAAITFFNPASFAAAVSSGSAPTVAGTYWSVLTKTMAMTDSVGPYMIYRSDQFQVDTLTVKQFIDPYANGPISAGVYNPTTARAEYTEITDSLLNYAGKLTRDQAWSVADGEMSPSIYVGTAEDVLGRWSPGKAEYSLFCEALKRLSPGFVPPTRFSNFFFSADPANPPTYSLFGKTGLTGAQALEGVINVAMRGTWMDVLNLA